MTFGIVPSRSRADCARSPGYFRTRPFIALARAEYVMRPLASTGSRSRSRVFSLSTSPGGIALTIGPILGVFLVGTFLRRVSQPPALIGMLVSSASMLYIFFFRPEIAWTWYVFIGSLITFVVAWLASFAFRPAPAELRQELELE